MSRKALFWRASVFGVSVVLLACLGVMLAPEPDPLESLYRRATQKGEIVFGANPRVRMQSLRVYGAKFQDVQSLLSQRFPADRGFVWEVGPWVKGSQVINISRTSDESTAMIIHFRDTDETYIERIEPLSDFDYWRLWVKRFGNLKGSPHSSISREP